MRKTLSLTFLLQGRNTAYIHFKQSALLMVSFLIAGLMVSCSTITPYTLDLAKESPHYGKLSSAEAVNIVKTKVRISGEDADSRSFVVDEDGFSYKKTTETTKTEWKNKKPVEIKSTQTITRHVPWSAVTEITPYLEQYKTLLPDWYRLELEFNITTVEYSRRTTVKHTIRMSCKNYEDLATVVAAMRILTDK